LRVRIGPHWAFDEQLISIFCQAWAARGEDISTHRIAYGFSQFYANRYAMYDAKSGKSRSGEVPVPYAGAYDVQFDDAKYAWGADMSTDLVQRLNAETGEWRSYLLPTSINTRHIDVQKSSRPLQYVD
jgi:streptogramin lyase